MLTENRDKIVAEVLILAQSCDYEKEHSHQVTKLALKIFDELKSLHGLGEKERLWLECGALLHDIGWISGRQGHHKKSLELIMGVKNLSFSEREKIMVGLIARYHRKALPQAGHKFFDDLTPEEKEVIRKSASFLRIADGLDRRHVSSVEDLSCEISPDTVIVRIKSKNFSDMEQSTAKEKADLFEQVFQKSLIIEWEKEKG